MSGNDLWVDPPNEPQPVQTVPKKRMSGCMLATLIGGGVGLVGLLTCCGIFAWFGSMMIPTTTNVPAEVTAVGRQILNVEVPADFQPTNAVTIDNMLMAMRIAQFKHREGKGEMMLNSMKIKIGNPGQANVPPDQMRIKFEEEIRSSLDTKKSETHDVMVNGQKVSVTISEATDRNNGKGVHIATAEMRTSNGQSFILLRMDDDVWDQDAVLKMLEDAKPAL